ncbi:MAG TPA: protein YgfX [Burkholderiales bacterium]|nr:protein YgfX [Burkholderiales bacterium]
MPAAPLLRLDLKPSPRLAAALALAHGLALAAAGLGLGGWPRWLAWTLILLSLGVTSARALLRTTGQAVSLELHEDGRASWKNRLGRWQESRLGGSHFVSAVLAIIELKTSPGRTKRVVIAADSVTPEDFRRLRVWLRWRRDPSVPDPQ